MSSGGSGFDKDRLKRLRRIMSGYPERGDVPGLIALVSRDDEAHVSTLGAMFADRPDPMERDTIFRIASLTKPIAAVAAMILVEECRMRLDQSIEQWLPEMADRRVLRSLSSEIDDTVPASRAITVRDVLTYTIGFGSIMAMPGTYPIQKLIRDYRIGGDGPLLPSNAPDEQQWMKSLGSLPLLAQPGERWMYNVSGDLLGVLISRVSGQSLGAFMKERIFDPLGMKDTAFSVPSKKIDRLAGLYFLNRETSELSPYENPEASAWAKEPPFESAAGGLVSTVDDYLAFSRMMLKKGRYGKKKILSRASVELMTSDQLTQAQRSGAELFLGSHSSWGLGVGVDIARNQIFHNPGRFGWTGGFGTTAYTDPGNGVIGILFTQRMMDSPEPPNVFVDFWTLAYEALR